MANNKIRQFTGSYKNAYFSYAGDERLRRNAASGGAVTAILLNALRSGTIGGALVCQRIIDKGHVRGRIVIAETESDLLKSQGSLYVTVPFNEHVRRLLSDFPGRIGVAGLPCNIRFLRALMNKDRNIREKVAFTIALFCGHISNPGLIDSLTEKLERRAGASLDDFYFRKGHWRGHLGASFRNGTAIEKPFSWFSLYQNLYFYCERKCLMCNDHFGYHADLSIGDIWTLSMKSNPIKHSGVLVRTDIGSRVFADTVDSLALVAESVPVQSVFEGQKRAAPTHYNTAAKRAAGKILGMRLSTHVHGSSNPVSFVVAFIILLNYRISRHRFLSKFITKIPRPFLKLYLYLFKFLETVQ